MSVRSALSAIAGSALLVAGLAVAGPSAVALAHDPDPSLGGTLWVPNQTLPYQWRSGQVPPTWMAAAIDAAATDATATRASRAASFTRTSSAASVIAYGEPTGCSAAGIACFSRMNAPTSFQMWFRANGYTFDWGSLRWCQGPSGYVNGCFDVETIALDEFGHVEILGHHVNLADQSDYADAVVQAVSRARPAAGWDTHEFARCDVARLQLEYGRPTAASSFSTCLAIATTTSLGASTTLFTAGSSVRFSATLRTAASSAYRALSGVPISGRAVLLQRRAPGSTTWSTVIQMSASATDGLYVATVSPLTTYDWRAVFATPSSEGISGSSSAAVRVTLSTCRTSIEATPGRHRGMVICP